MLKKQVKKLTKKILIVTLASSLIFTSCFCHKKMEVKAASVAASLSAYTLYEICLYFGTLAVSALGIGYAYENRDEIAKFGKNIIDSMVEIPEQGWFFGATAPNGDPTIYGREALVAIQMAQWASIVLGGQSPQNNNNNNDDDDESEDPEDPENPEEPQDPEEPLNDYDKRTNELGFINFFLTSAGLSILENSIESYYNENVDEEKGIINTFDISTLDNIIRLEGMFASDFSYSNKDEVKALIHSIVEEHSDNRIFFDGWYVTEDNYFLMFDCINWYRGVYDEPYFCCNYPLPFINYKSADGTQYWGFVKSNAINDYHVYGHTPTLNSVKAEYIIDSKHYLDYCNGYQINDYATYKTYLDTGKIPGITLNVKRVADWIKDDNDWQGYLEDIATSLRSLQDLTAIAQALAEGVSTTQPSADEYGDMMVNLGNEYAPKTDPISEPTYYPATNTTPKLDPSVFPNYQPGVNPDPGTNPDSPGDDSGGEPPADTEIDLDGLLSIFNILFYLIMIIIMLIYLFLACLAFVVMIFRIPASSSMLPDDMVLGLEHLKSIMIPGMNISIYGFAMALIYMFIIFAIIRAIRLEINDFKFPRSFK